jgi:hypothetical protein
MKKKLLAFLASFPLLLSSFADTVVLEWMPSPSTNLCGYYLYTGTESHFYTHRTPVEPTATTTTVSNLVEGTTYYFALTSYDENNLESEFSNEVNHKAGTNAIPIILKIARLGYDTFRITGETTPTNKVNILGTTNVVATPWILLTNLVAKTNGQFLFDHSATNGMYFYRGTQG